MERCDHVVEQRVFAHLSQGEIVNDENKPLGHRDWLKELDLDESISCDTVGCQRSATVWTKVGCCDAVIISCRNCMIDLITVLNLRIRARHPVYCTECEQHVDPQGWITRPEPI
jgi:hypothetical protein